MSTSIKTLERLKKYVNNSLSAEERASLEEELKGNPELQEELNLTRMLISESETLEQQRLLGVIEAIEKDEDLNDHKVSKIRKLPTQYKLLLAAASILLLFVTGWWWFTSNQNQSTTYLEEAYIDPSFNNLFRGANSNDALTTAASEYLNQNYQKSLDSLGTFSEDDSLYLFALWLEGCNYFKLGHFENAQLAFDTLIRLNSERSFYEKPDLINVHWIRILSALAQWEKEKKDDQKQELNRMLNNFLSKVNDPPKDYIEKAIQLQEMLR